MHSRRFHDRELNSVSDGEDHSTIVMKVYEKHVTRKDILVGSFAGTIGNVLENLKDGGMNSFGVMISEIVDVISLIKVLEEPLPNLDGSGHSGFTIKFTLSSDKHGDMNADERQAADAVTGATEAVGALVPTPAVVGALSTAVDIGPRVATGLMTSDQMFGVLLQRIDLFDKIVASIAQVFVVHRPDCHWPECGTASSLHVACLVRIVRCKQCMSLYQ